LKLLLYNFLYYPVAYCRLGPNFLGTLFSHMSDTYNLSSAFSAIYQVSYWHKTTCKIIVL
jgi:hypothetical protein